MIPTSSPPPPLPARSGYSDCDMTQEGFADIGLAIEVVDDDYEEGDDEEYEVCPFLPFAELLRWREHTFVSLVRADH